MSKYKVLKSNKKSNYKVLELFAGCGGTALGFHNAGLEHIALVENDKNAVATLQKNKKDWKVINEDIREVSFKGMKPDIVEAGFPCQAFSYAGNKMGFEDNRGQLIFEVLRCVKETKPKIAVAENVRGLINHNKGETLKQILKAFEDLGYRVDYKLLNAQFFDTPQKRERLIILAIRKDLDIPFIFPEGNDYVLTLKHALKNCPKSPGSLYPEKKKKILDLVPSGGCWRDLPEKIQKEYMGKSFYLGGGKTGMARRLSYNEPSLTLTCSPSQKQTERCHPEETRPFTTREYARIQTFPDTWEFEGSTSAIYKQIGNAVPVNLGFHIGKCVIEMLDAIKK